MAPPAPPSSGWSGPYRLGRWASSAASAYTTIIAIRVSGRTILLVLETLLAVTLLARLGWWREAGFSGPSRLWNLHLLLFPLLVGALGLLGGVRSLEPALRVPALLGMLIATFGAEAIYRGLLWRVLAPKVGMTRAVVTTSLLYGALNLGGLASAGPWPEAFYLTVLAICAGFTTRRCGGAPPRSGP